jgi:hypothetical protein
MPGLPVQKHAAPTYHTLEEIRQRKEQLSDELQKDSTRFSTLWGQLFVKRKDATKGEFIASMVTNSITAIDAFLLVRKLLKNYRSIFRR